MRELGDEELSAHAGLAEPVRAAKIDQLILIGPEMDPLVDVLGGSIPAHRIDDVATAAALLQSLLRPGEAVLVKASNSVGLAKLVEAVAGGAA